GAQEQFPSPARGGGQGGGLGLVHGFAKPSAAVDFTKPDAVEWFKAKNRRRLEMGVAVIKTDFAEDMPDDAVPHDGTSAEQLHNLYPLLYQRAVFEATKEVHGYGLIWGRSGYAGSQRYPVHWGGDPGCTFDDMAASLRGALSWILSGAAFASFDMGGFFGIPTLTDPPSPELYVRWSQMGLLVSPMCKPRGSREIYLPDGGWFDYWTDRQFDGARWITYEAELDALPLFVRSGAVIPMGPELQYAHERAWDPLSFDVYPGEAKR